MALTVDNMALGGGTGGNGTAGNGASSNGDGRQRYGKRCEQRRCERRRVRLPSASGGGYGLRGIAERVALLGGHVEAGPTAEGWRVEAVVPLEPVAGERTVQA